MMMRAGLIKLIRDFDGFEIVGEANDGQQTLELVAALTPDIVLLDILMPGLNGLDVLARIRQNFPAVRVLILSMNSAEEYVLQAMTAGAHGYLVKSDSPIELELALNAVAHGDTFLSSAVSKHVISGYLNRVDRKPHSKAEPVGSFRSLTSRQREIVQLVAEGLTSREIAEKLTISVKTVETHRYQIMSQLGLHDTAALVRYAVGKELVGTGM